ncbi:MAG: pyridoxal phosphate-dependent aminotransferase [Deltaproteobacteria bacterium]|nr:pyridoxal phosphate-dependent aminotransferase [Deltaproteobacteria bacterium]
MRLSERARAVKPSATLATAARARALKAEGKDVVLFGTGEPDFDTPAFIRQAAKDALDAGATHYPPLVGLPSLREAICTRLKLDQELDYAASEVIVGVGAKQVLYNACQALLDPGDEAVIITPYWVSYPDMVTLAGATSVYVETTPESGFQPTAEALEAALNERTRVLFVNSPSNPSGVILDRETLEAMAEVLRRYPEVTILTDDIYNRILYGDATFENILQVAPDLRDRVVIINGVSKTYAMTGWRVGWAVGPEEIIKAIGKIQGQSTSGATSFAQHGALAALTGDQGVVAEMVGHFARRRDLLCDGLAALPGVECAKPPGAFYAFPDLRALIGKKAGGKLIDGSITLCDLLIEEQHLACVPGAPFGAEGFLRMSFAASDEDIERGLKRLADFLQTVE